MEQGEIISNILSAKAEAGDDAYLWVHTSGDCILWPSEESSIGDAGESAIKRWHVSASTVNALLSTGEVDEIA